MFPGFKRIAFNIADEKPKWPKALSLKVSSCNIDGRHTLFGAVDFWIYPQRKSFKIQSQILTHARLKFIKLDFKNYQMEAQKEITSRKSLQDFLLILILFDHQSDIVL
jgi:hypothetical protein